MKGGLTRGQDNMEHPSIDLDQVRQSYMEWLVANKRSFNTHRSSLIQSLKWVTPESVVDANSILQYWQGPMSSKPSAHRFVGELFDADILFKITSDGPLKYAVKDMFFRKGIDDSGS